MEIVLLSVHLRSSVPLCWVLRLVRQLKKAHPKVCLFVKPKFLMIEDQLARAFHIPGKFHFFTEENEVPADVDLIPGKSESR